MIRVYITPFSELGGFASEVEVTADVDKGAIGKITKRLEGSDFDVGLYKTSALKIKLSNWDGRYSDVTDFRSIFRVRRSGSKIRITWAAGETAVCGFAKLGEAAIWPEKVIFEGFLDDSASKMNIDDQMIELQARSFDSVLEEAIYPHTEVSPSDKISEVIFACLEASRLSDYVDYALEDITPAVDQEIDSEAKLINKTVREALVKLLEASNSVLIIDHNGLRVCGRSPSDETLFHFYGQNSESGNENILDIRGFRNGQNRIFNFVNIKDQDIKAQETDSIAKWGVRKKELEIDILTDNTKLGNVCAALVDEFHDPKMELSLITPLNYDTIELAALDKVDVDYPTVYHPDGEKFPVVGVTVIGDPEAKLPHLQWAFELFPTTKFKIMGIDVDFTAENIELQLREV